MFKLKFTLEAGLLVRRSLKREIERYCFDEDLDLELRESKGLLESSFFVKISGPASKAGQVKRRFDAWLEDLKDA